MNSLELFSGLVSSLDTSLSLATRVAGEIKSLGKRRSLKHNSSPDYENDFIEEVIDIRDAAGQSAVLEKRQRVRFRHSESAILRDGLWGDGDQLARYSVRGARRIGVKREGLRTTVLLVVEPRPAEGEACQFAVRRVMRNAFKDSEAFFDLMAERPTGHLSLKVLFPRSRPPRSAHLVQWPLEKTLRVIPVRYAPDRRPFLTWRESKPIPLTAYSLRWIW